MRIISPIGNKRRRARECSSGGFSFFEVMLTVSVLAVGLVFIYRAFFISLDYVNHVTYRLHASNLLNNEIRYAQRVFEDRKRPPAVPYQDFNRVVINNRPVRFRYEAGFEPLGGLENLYRMEATLSWRERQRDIRLSRVVYLSYPTEINDDE